MDIDAVRGLLLNLLAEYEALQVESRYFRQQYGQPPELLGARRDEDSSAMSTVFAASSNTQPQILIERTGPSQLATSSSIINIQPTKQMELLNIDELPVENWVEEIDSNALGAERRDPLGSQKPPLHFSESVKRDGCMSASSGAAQRTTKRLKIRSDYKSDSRGPLLKLIEHRWFERVMGLIIFVNVSFMGYAADYAMNNLQNPEPLGVKMIDLLFCICYSTELAMKMIAHGRSLLRPPHRNWNLFDTLLVAQGIYDQFVTFVVPAASLIGNVSFLRSLRLMKMLKMLRVVRLMREMRELRIILTAIMGSVQSMFWSLVLIVVVLYVFALVIVQAFAKHLSSQDNDAQAASDYRTIDQINRYWGSIGSAMMSLFACSTGGSDWRDVAKPIDIMGPGVYALFWFYIAFFIFVILNTITALCVETTIAISMRDYQVRIQLELEKKDDYKEMLQCLFDEMDDTGDGLVSVDEFSRHMEDERMGAFLACMGLEVFDALHFYRLMSAGGTHPVDCDQFVTNCIRMSGQAMSMDVHELLTRVRHFNKVADEKLNGTLSIAMELAGHFNIDAPELKNKKKLFRDGSLYTSSSDSLQDSKKKTTGDAA